MEPPTPSASGNLDVDRFLAHHLTMRRIRAFEETAVSALAEGLVKGGIHPSIGQEAAAAGVCSNMAADDILLSNHRGHGHTIAKGASPEAMMRELFGRAGGTCGGKGGSMHIADFGVGMLGANGVVGANINIAAGAAHAIKLLGQGRITVCIFGDGAINRGPFLEGLNWAKVFHLPVLFICEDNRYSATTLTSAMSAGDGPAARAASLGLKTATLDGNDIVAVDAVARENLDAVRTGAGPRFLHVVTYRLGGHTAVDPAAYRPAGEAEDAWRNDPIGRCEALLAAHGIDDDVLRAQTDRAATEIAAAYQAAKAAPWPSADLAFADVQDVGAEPVPAGGHG
jgi:pyruvate dehydrogenase E1 component alpha subunit